MKHLYSFSKRSAGPILAIVALAAPANANDQNQEPLVIKEQGAYAFGGKILGDFDTASIHCDHGYVEYQIPVNAREVPLLMWHSSSTKTWETTFAGEDGFKNIFLHRGFAEYIIDPPRVGRAGWGCEAWAYEPDIGRDQAQITSWRLGLWNPPNPPEFFPNVQFPVNDPDAIDQVLRARYPEFNDPVAVQVETDEVAKLADDIGPTVLITHSGSGIRGWWTALKTKKLAGIVAYEPSDFIFPTGVDPVFPTEDPVPLRAFKKLSEIPIQIVYGDNIPAELTGVPGRDGWVEAKANAELFVQTINDLGGDAQLLVLPEIGIYGNTHFPMSDLNNDKIADLLFQYLKEKGLTSR
jgi:hypothetical protein